MAEMVHDGWYALRGTPEPSLRAERARQAAALYNSGMGWLEIRAAIHCNGSDLGNLLREGGIIVGSRRPDMVRIVHPDRSSLSPLERWTREVQTTPSPCMNAALDRHTAAIWQMHADLGIAPPELP